MWLRSVVAVVQDAAAALTDPLAWELPYAMGAALKKKKKRCMVNPQALMCRWTNMVFGSYNLRTI